MHVKRASVVKILVVAVWVAFVTYLLFPIAPYRLPVREEATKRVKMSLRIAEKLVKYGADHPLATVSLDKPEVRAHLTEEELAFLRETDAQCTPFDQTTSSNAVVLRVPVVYRGKSYGWVLARNDGSTTYAVWDQGQTAGTNSNGQSNNEIESD